MSQQRGSERVYVCKRSIADMLYVKESDAWRVS
jgi:hypothetical protein